MVEVTLCLLVNITLWLKNKNSVCAKVGRRSQQQLEEVDESCFWLPLMGQPGHDLTLLFINTFENVNV